MWYSSVSYFDYAMRCRTPTFCVYIHYTYNMKVNGFPLNSVSIMFQLIVLALAVASSCF